MAGNPPHGKDADESLLASRRHFPTLAERRRDALVAQWVGSAAAPGVLGKLHSQPKTIGGCVDRYLSKIHQDDAIVLQALRENWPSLTGPDVARQLLPQALRGTTLVIAAANQTLLFAFRDPKLRDPLIHNLSGFTDGRITEIQVVPPGRR